MHLTHALAAKPLGNRAVAQTLSAVRRILPVGRATRNLLLNRAEAISRTSEVESRPFKAVLNLTGACNLRCAFCEIHHVYGTFPDRYRNTIDVEATSKYASLLEDVRSIELGGGLGEPLLNPYFGDIVALLRGRNSSMRLSVTTNGLLLTPRVIETMTAVGFDHVLISIHAASRAVYSRLTGGDYDRLTANIRSLVSARRAAGARKPEIGLAFALNTINSDDALEYPELGRTLGVDYVHLSHYYAGQNQLGEDVAFQARPADANRIVKAVYKRARAVGIRIMPERPPWLPELPPADDAVRAFDRDRVIGNPCREPYATIQLKSCVEHEHAHYVGVCNRISLLRVDYREYPFADPQREIWNHPVFQHLRQTANTPPYNPICRFCRNEARTALRSVDNGRYRAERDGAVRQFLAEAGQRAGAPGVNGLEILDENPYQ